MAWLTSEYQVWWLNVFTTSRYILASYTVAVSDFVIVWLFMGRCLSSPQMCRWRYNELVSEWTLWLPDRQPSVVSSTWHYFCSGSVIPRHIMCLHLLCIGSTVMIFSFGSISCFISLIICNNEWLFILNKGNDYFSCECHFVDHATYWIC